MSIEKRKRADGSVEYRVRYYTKQEDGTRSKQSSKWFPTARDAKNWEIENIFDDGASNSRITFEQVFIRYMKNEELKHNKQTTVVEKRQLITTYFKDLMKKRIQAIKPSDIKKEMSNPKFARLSTERKNKCYQILSSIFKYSIIYCNTNNNPMIKIERFKKSEQELMKETSIWNRRQFNKFISSIDPSRSEYIGFFTLLYFTGCRLNELRSMTFSRWNDNKLKIDRQISRLETEFTSVKSKSGRRTISIPDNCVEIIEEQYEKYRHEQGFNMDWFIFGGATPLSRTNITRIKDDTIKLAELPYIRIHDFRHSHVSYLIDKGVNIYKISKRIGHASISITLDRYGHLLDKNDDEILNALSD